MSSFSEGVGAGSACPGAREDRREETAPCKVWGGGKRPFTEQKRASCMGGFSSERGPGTVGAGDRCAARSAVGSEVFRCVREWEPGFGQ